MFEIDKQKFGAFVAQLRKEKGLTQKEMAGMLFISDKAISKWENGVSIPDTALLVPLSELLEVSVTELLMCRRTQHQDQMDSGEVERIVKTAISYSEEAPSRAYQTVGKWAVIYVLSLLAGAAGLYLCYLQGTITDAVLTAILLGAIFGAYFCFLVRTKLPDYYDQNKISGVYDGAFRMNVPGLTFNNSNWPHIVGVGRIWACASTGIYPLLSAGMLYFAASSWLVFEKFVFLLLILGGLFVPVYYVGKKYQ